jgi:hypothetical protein
LQEARLFAALPSSFAVFVAFWHFMCLLFLSTCLVSIIVAVYVLALDLFRFLLSLCYFFSAVRFSFISAAVCPVC